MKGTLVAFDQIGGRGAAASMLDGQLHDLLIDAPEGRIAPGAIYRAKAGRPMKGQGGLILQTPDGPLFLRQTKGISPGDMLLVQTTTYAEPGKATPCTQRLILKSRFAILTPGAPGLNVSRAIRDEARVAELKTLAAPLAEGLTDMGVILRSAAGEAVDDDIVEDITHLRDLVTTVMSDPEGASARLLDAPRAATLAFHDWPRPDVTDADPGSFERHGILDAIDALRRPHTPLPGGAGMFIEPTRALVAVDVNTGGDTSPAAGLKANVAALKALPRALRLRGLGGQIVVDLAPFAKRDRTQLEQVASRALKADGIETTLVGWTPLGHLELQRKRERLPLTEALT